MESIIILLWGCLAALVGYFMYTFMIKNKSYWKSRGVPSIKIDSAFSRIFKKTFLEIDETIYKYSSDPFGGYFETHTPIFFARDLDLIKNIYVKDFDHFVNRRTFKSDDIFNDMVINKENKEWKDLRAKMTPTFTTGKIRKMFPLMNESAKKLIPYLTQAATKNDGNVDMEDALGDFAMDIISSTAFGIDSQIFDSADSIVAKMVKKLIFKPNPLMLLKFFLFMAFPFLNKIIKLRFIDEESENFFSKLLHKTIKHRESTGEKRSDFIQVMIETKNGQIQAEMENEEEDFNDRSAQSATDGKKKTGLEIDDEIIVANCFLFIFAGFVTIQSALTFGAYSLALNRDIQDKLRKELQEAVETNGGEISYDVIMQHEYLDKVINETLRMYPPTLRTERTCTKDYPVPNFNVVVPKDTIVAISVYQTHHNEKYFPNPEVFDPERFSTENKANRNPYAFMPFGHGPRSCIANRFALTEAKTLIANLVLNFDVEPCGKTQIPLKFEKGRSLKPSQGMWLNLQPITN